MRAIDRVGNVGSSIDVDVKVDVTEPEGIAWNVEEISTSNIGPINVSFSAQDLISGIDLDNSKIQYGFDLNGVGATPDQSGEMDRYRIHWPRQYCWNIWATKSRQYLMLRAIVTDNAGNELVTSSAFQNLPGLGDLSWNATETGLDRLVTSRPGDTNGQIEVTSLLEANQAYGGAVTVHLQAAPADRDSTIDWTTMQTVVVEGGNLSDDCQCEYITWNYVVPNTGQWDLRLVIVHLTQSMREMNRITTTTVWLLVHRFLE